MGNAPGNTIHHEGTSYLHEEHEYTSRFYCWPERVKASGYHGPRRNLNPAERSMVIPIGVVSKLPPVGYRPRLRHIGSFIVLIVRKVEHVDAVQGGSNEQKAKNQQPFPMLDRPLEE